MHIDRLLAGLILTFSMASAHAAGGPPPTDLRVGASAVNLKCDGTMVLAGMIEARYADQQEGELRAIAVVIEKPGVNKIGIVACDVLWIPRSMIDEILAEIQKTTGIPPQNILINATHTHHAPSTAPAHAFGVSLKFCEELKRGIVRAVEQANQRLAGGDAAFFFALGEEKTVGANSRLKLRDGNITWLNPAHEAGDNPVPTGPFDPQLPVLDFRDARGKTRALIFNHSTHTIGTRGNKNVRSPSFYGIAAQELEAELGGTVSFLEGASGSTHNISQVPFDVAVARLKNAVKQARAHETREPVDHLAAIRRTMKFRVRHFNDAEEDAKILRYTSRYAPAASDRIRHVFAEMRKKLKDKQGEERETYVQAMRIDDVALVGVPAEYFTVLGLDIKHRSPFKHTYVAELANDWIGYLPNREGHELGGYQTWMGLHSYAEPGTGERVADLAVEILNDLAKAGGRKPMAKAGSSAAPQAGRLTVGSEKVARPPASRGRRSPQDEQRTFRLADPALTIELVAAEPDVVSPVALGWDADGRLYVAEMGGYPVTARKGRIRQLRDDDGDGHYEKSVVFADGLNFPTTVMPFRGGILTIDAPDLLFLRDTDGDGKADERRVEWTGFIPGSQQLRANALHWGLDNWIYGANGRCDGEVRRGDAAAAKGAPAVSIRGRDFRFRLPLAASGGPAQFEAIAGQSQFGQCHDDWGHRFLSWNVIPVRQAVVPEPYASQSPLFQARSIVDIASPDDTGRVFPISPPPRQFNAESADYYNAMCGLTIFRGDALGGYRGNAFIGESLSNLVTRRILKPNGAAYISERGEHDREFLASGDSWFHPVFLATGPDGSLYVADFYREYVEHPLYVASEEIRKHVPWGNGADNGRIWRISRADRHNLAAGRRPRLARATNEQLVAALSHPVGWWRDTAQRLLVERQDPAAVPLLKAAVRADPATLGSLHALATLDGLHAADYATLRTAIDSNHPRVREEAIAIAARRPEGVETLWPVLLDHVRDADAGVRLRLALALGSSSTLADATRLPALASLVDENRFDPWVSSAVLSSARGRTDRLLRLLLADNRRPAVRTVQKLQFFVDAGRELSTELTEQDLAEFVGWCARGSAPRQSSLEQFVLLGGIAGSAQTKASSRPAAGGPAAVADCFRLVDGPRRKQIAESALKIVGDASRPAIVRSAAVRLMTFGPRAEVGPRLIALLTDAHAAEVRDGVAEALAERDDPETCRAVYREWDRLGREARRSIFASAARSESATMALVEAVAADVVRPVEVPIDVVEQLKRTGSEATRRRAAAVFRASVAADRLQVVEQYKPAVARTGDVLKGAALFRENCMTCHTIQRFGGQVGPELSGVSSRPRELLLYDILDPSARISTDFLNYVLVTQEGKTYEGLLISQTGDGVRLRRAKGEEILVPAAQVEQLRASRKSLMPEGFETKISVAAMADLLTFLRQPSRDLLKTGPSAPAVGVREERNR